MTTGNWNGFPKASPLSVVAFEQPFRFPSDTTSLAVGLGRSYGDVCLNNGQTVITTHHLQGIKSFDHHNGTIVVGSGCSLSAVHALTHPQGWSLPVVPGTAHVTVGGAIANDIHGKNHHQQGTFGDHVDWIDLVRSEGVIRCSPDENAELFRSTVGGLGLSGIIVRAQLRLHRVGSTRLRIREIRTASLDETLDVLSEQEGRWPCSVAWIDLLCTHDRRGRGIVSLATESATSILEHEDRRGLHLPAPFMKAVMHERTVRLGNAVRYGLRSGDREFESSFASYHHPLDRVKNWNAAYGRRGFVQYQCVVPPTEERPFMQEFLHLMRMHEVPIYLAVMKRFGERAAAGTLSFAMDGLTLATDIPLAAQGVLPFLDAVDAVVVEAGGRVYPAKDARMSAPTFQVMYPQWTVLERWRDPHLSSSFWRRVTRPS
jgi:FAD/FMN-containing dehydrogenase